MYFTLAESADAGHKTVSFATLANARLVSREWRDAVDSLRLLIATPSFLVLNNGQPPRFSMLKFYERMQVERTRQVPFETVSFNLCTRFFSPETEFDNECARVFVSALTNCRAAHISIDLSDQELEVLETPVRTQRVKMLELRKFLWKSVYMGIRHALPGKYGFPSGLRTLRQGLPWEQLTHVHLDCPLSTSDVFFILECGSSTLKVARLATVKDDTGGLDWSDSDTIRLDSLESLTIHSQHALDDLFSRVQFPKLTRLELNIESSLFSPRLSSILNIGHPWQQLSQIELNCPLSISDAYLVFFHGWGNLKQVHLATVVDLEGTTQLQQNPTVTMSSLTSLAIDSRVNLHSLFSRLHMPTLIRLALTLGNVEDCSDLLPVYSQQHNTFASLSNSQGQPLMLDPNLNIPWDQLRYLNISYNCWQDCALSPIVLHCTRLHRLSIASATSCLIIEPVAISSFPAEIELGMGVRCDDILQCIINSYGQLTALKTVHAPSLLAVSMLSTLQIKDLFVVDAITTPLLSELLDNLQRHLITGKFRIKDAERSEVDAIIGVQDAEVEVSLATSCY